MGMFYRTMTLEFCERLKDADWSCNVSTLDNKEFKREYKDWLFRLNELEYNAFERMMQEEEE